jgi:Cof subfamily protein (haloacid dehalogenase superfamily)
VNPPRLIATDLDGTLVRPDDTISERTVSALARAAAAGTRVVLVTGRPARWLPRVYTALAASYPAICGNGAAIYDPVTETVRDARPLAVHVLQDVCTRLRAHIPGIRFAVEVDGGRAMLHEQGYELRWDLGDPAVRMVTGVELTTVSAIKLLARAPDRDADRLSARIRSLVDRSVEVTHSSSTGLVEMSAAGITKASGLAAFADAHGVDARDAVAFGDMPNDVPMLRWAGHGVAVANAHPEALAVADDVTLSNVDDGVAVYLERWYPAEMPTVDGRHLSGRVV